MKKYKNKIDLSKPFEPQLMKVLDEYRERHGKEKKRKALFMPEELHEKLKKRADKNNRKMVGQIEYWLEAK